MIVNFEIHYNIRVHAGLVVKEWFDFWHRRYRPIRVPEPYQAGVEPQYPTLDTPWVIYIPAGRWQTRQPIPICPLIHPVRAELES